MEIKRFFKMINVMQKEKPNQKKRNLFMKIGKMKINTRNDRNLTKKKNNNYKF